MSQKVPPKSTMRLTSGEESSAERIASASQGRGLSGRKRKHPSIMQISDFSKIKSDKAIIATALSQITEAKCSASMQSDTRDDTNGIYMRIETPWNRSHNSSLGSLGAIIKTAACDAIKARLAELAPELIALAIQAAENAYVEAAKQCQAEAIEILSIANAKAE